ncbi:DDE-type integrase/transposase/recombinase [Peribacillus simplex]|uniref:DDE-type integrase/transposase/recombinase n=1 Tax=Peribacillus simplex TaxID=1478 RepID=UPI00399A0744
MRLLLGSCLHGRDLHLVLDRLNSVTEKRNVYRTILHSDQGFQYTSHAYHKQLAQLGVIGRPFRKGNCHL